MARFHAVLLFFLTILNLSVAAKLPALDYDVIIVGGGPAGLSTLSALCRVSRRAILFDTKEYRNNATRNMHDVIGADGYPPTDFRALARAQIDKYELATFSNKKIVQVMYAAQNGHHVFKVKDQDGKWVSAHRLVLATGVTDILPETPGVMDAYGKGMYWCPWCDGFEHRDQSLAVLGPLSDALSSVLEMHNINPDTIVLTNGTDTPLEREIATNRSATWEQQLESYKVPIINNTIVRIERLRDGGEACSAPAPGKPNPHAQHEQQQIFGEENTVIPVSENAGPNGKHYDLFRIHFKDGLILERAAFLVNIPVKQTSTLPDQLKLKLDGPKVAVGPKLNTSMEGVFAVGDMNNEGSTNVPHAMYNGKKAAVVIHVQLAKEASLASIQKRGLTSFNEFNLEKISLKQIGNDLEQLWESVKAQYAP